MYLPRNYISSAFTLIEVMIVAIIIAILVSVTAIIGLNGQKESAERRSMVMRVKAIDQARITYYQTSDTASSSWTNAGSDAARYTLLKTAGLINDLPASFAAAFPSPYAVVFGEALMTKTLLTVNGNTIRTY